MNSTLYNQDYYQWIQETVKLLEQRNFQELDLDNLIEEIQDLARNEKQIIETNLIVVFKLLLKWQYQPEQHSGERFVSLRITIEHPNFRQNPSSQSNPNGCIPLKIIH